MKILSLDPMRQALPGLVAVVMMAVVSPAALAGGHGRHDGHTRYAFAGYGHYGDRHARSNYGYSRHYRYQPSRRYYSYRRHPGHWGPGEVLGAVVAGAIITHVIADAFQPRTTVIERRVYRSDDPVYSDGYDQRDRYNTRYVGRDDSYYQRGR